ncbi:MAG: hypothetical protein V3W31_05640 [Thermodesulfobacteriota bacterium]
MSDPAIVSYLKLAYLAEISVVFNLAFLGWKRRENLKALREQARGTTTLGGGTGSVCDKRDNGCWRECNETTGKKKFEDVDVDYIAKMARALQGYTGYEFKGSSREKHGFIEQCKDLRLRFTVVREHSKLLRRAWTYGKCWRLKRWYLGRFHDMVLRDSDYWMSFFALPATAVILIVATFMDTNAIPMVSGDILWLQSKATWWIVGLGGILASLVVMPGVFFISWRYLNKEHECLVALLTEAFQRKSPGTLDTQIEKLGKYRVDDEGGDNLTVQ